MPIFIFICSCRDTPNDHFLISSWSVIINQTLTPLTPKMSSWKDSIQWCATVLCLPHSVICWYHIENFVNQCSCTMNIGITVSHHVPVPVLAACKHLMAHLNSCLEAFFSCPCHRPLASESLTQDFSGIPLNHCPCSNVIFVFFFLKRNLNYTYSQSLKCPVYIVLGGLSNFGERASKYHFAQN